MRLPQIKQILKFDKLNEPSLSRPGQSDRLRAIRRIVCDIYRRSFRASTCRLERDRQDAAACRRNRSIAGISLIKITSVRSRNRYTADR
jgi:hypothetical protein